MLGFTACVEHFDVKISPAHIVLVSQAQTSAGSSDFMDQVRRQDFDYVFKIVYLRNIRDFFSPFCYSARVFFFFLPPLKAGASSHAAQAFLDAIAHRKLTYTEVAEKMGTSRIVLNKLVEGRPLSPAVLQSLLKVFDGEDGDKILAGHLFDEIQRGGKKPEEFLIIRPEKFRGVIELLMKQIENNERRRSELVELVLKWQRQDLVNPRVEDAGSSPPQDARLNASRPKRGRGKASG